MLGFSVDIDENQSHPIVYVKGEVDIYTCGKLRTALMDLIDRGQKKFILNLEDIHYIDSTGLGTIAHSAQAIQNDKGEICVVCTKPQIKKIFEVSGLEEKNITLYDKEADALEHIQEKHSQLKED